MLERVTREFANQTVVLFTHGGVIDTSFLFFFGLPTMRPPEFRLYTLNTSITHWGLEPDHSGVARWRLVSYNDDLHVRDIGASERIRWPSDLGEHAEAAGSAPAVPVPTEAPTDG
jgi:probable phosphoglycerate mutase